MAILDDLGSYYRRKGIHAGDFSCPHWDCCNKAAGLPDRAVAASSAYVGKAYGGGKMETGGLPALLFLSLDPGKIGENDDRTPEGVQFRVGEGRLEPRNIHWVWTHELAAAILACRDREIAGLHMSRHAPLAKPGHERLGRLMTVRHYFAHANTAKCCLNIQGSRQAHQIVYENCWKYLREEVQVLNPRIVVTQGRNAYKYFLLSFFQEAYENAGDPGSWDDPYPPTGYRTFKMPGRDNPALWLPTRHPNSPRPPYKGGWRTKWKYTLEACAKAALDFLKEGGRGCAKA